MKCPRCGRELRRSRKDPAYGLCDNCRKKFKWIDDFEEDDYEEDVPQYPRGGYNQNNFQGYRPKQKKKGGCLKVALIVIGILVVLTIIGSLFGEDSEPSTGGTDTGAKQEEKKREEETPDIPKEYSSALSKAEQYSDTLHMSKQGIYDQLVSEYGEQFSEEAAQYAIDNLEADYKANALEKAKEYQDTMDMSPEAIRDQLTSEYGEKFTQEEADYAVENLE